LDSDLASWVFILVVLFEVGVLTEGPVKLGLNVCIAGVFDFHNGDVSVCESRFR